MKISQELKEKTPQFHLALERFVERLKEDRNILAAVRLGSMEEHLICSRERIHLWIIEADGVTKKRKSDGNDEHILSRS